MRGRAKLISLEDLVRGPTKLSMRANAAAQNHGLRVKHKHAQRWSVPESLPCRILNYLRGQPVTFGGQVKDLRRALALPGSRRWLGGLATAVAIRSFVEPGRMFRIADDSGVGLINNSRGIG